MGCAVRLRDHGSPGGRLIPSGAREPKARRRLLAAADLMRVFRACPVPDSRLLGGLPWMKFYNLLPCRIPCGQGKMQGISPNQAFFAKNRLENTREFS
jgi:hypothetical protein